MARNGTHLRALSPKELEVNENKVLKILLYYKILNPFAGKAASKNVPACPVNIKLNIITDDATTDQEKNITGVGGIYPPPTCKKTPTKAILTISQSDKRPYQENMNIRNVEGSH